MTEISLDDEAMDSAAMAEAMGFSGFGMQRPASKKRRFNPNADAAVSGVSDNNNNSNKPASTGANTAPLGRQRLRLPPPSSELPARPSTTATRSSGPVAGKADTDEIDLDDRDPADSLERDVPAGDDHVGGEDLGSQYMDTSRPSRGYLPEELAEIEAQDKIDAILVGGIPGLPARPPAVASSEGIGGYGHHHGQRNDQQGRGNDRRHPQGKRRHPTGDDDSGAPWWEGYYDPKVNQNPWEALEKKMGLQPRGTWLPKYVKPAGLETEIQGDTHATNEEEDGAAGKSHTDEPV